MGQLQDFVNLCNNVLGRHKAEPAIVRKHGETDKVEALSSGPQGGLKIEGAPGGDPVIISGAVVVDTSLLATEITAAAAAGSAAAIDTSTAAIDVSTAAIDVSIASLDGKLAVDVDNDPVTVNPVIMGGRYLEDPFADPLDNNEDAGTALINKLRMFVTEDRAYDAGTDAVKSVPVSDPTGAWEPAPMDGTLAADGSVTRYMDMRSFLRWALIFQPTRAAAEIVTLTIAQSHDDVDDPATAVFEDVTDEFFGVSGFASSKYIGPENPVSCTWLRAIVTVTGWTAGTSAWVLRGLKSAQA